MKNKVIIGVVVLALVAAGSMSYTQNTPASKGGIIKIGVIGPLTGGASVYGVNLVKGAELALRDIGETRNRYELVIEDDGTNPANAASAAQKLINIDKVSAIISVTSGTGNAIKPIATAAKIPQICMCSDSRVADGEYNFTNILLAPDETKTWLEHAAEKGVKKIAILAQNQPGYNLIIDSLLAQIKDTDITIVFNDRIEPNVRDFNTAIVKARATKPDLILVGFFPPQLDIIGQQLKNLGVTNIAGIATFAIGADPTLFNGRWYSDASLSDPAFETVFTKAYPDTRFNVRVAPYAYDSVNLIVKAFESGKPANEYLLGVTSYPGKAGTITKQAGEASFHAPIGIWEIREGKPVQVK